MDLGFKNARDPIVYVLNQELRKRNLKDNLQLDAEAGWDGTLVEYPVQLIRDENNKVVKCLYGVGDEQWSEEIIRDDNNIATAVKTTYPDGSVKTVHIHRSGNLVDFLTEA